MRTARKTVVALVNVLDYLQIDGGWFALLIASHEIMLPLSYMPTTHIIKLPIGKIESHSHSIEMSESVENEYLCMLIASIHLTTVG